MLYGEKSKEREEREKGQSVRETEINKIKVETEYGGDCRMSQGGVSPWTIADVELRAEQKKITHMVSVQVFKKVSHLSNLNV